MALQTAVDPAEQCQGQITRLVQQLQRAWPEAIQLGLEDTSPSVYDHFPHLFQQAFPGVAPEQIQPLALAGRLIANIVLVNDSLFDKPQPLAQLTVATLRLQALQHETYGLLYRLFPAEARFWDHWRTNLSAYLQACCSECLFASGERAWAEYSEAQALQIIEGKSCLLRNSVAGLAELSGDHHLVVPLCRSINHYNVGRQLFDDLCDWKEDLQRGVPSLLLARLLGPDEPPRQAREQPDRLAALSYRLYAEGHAQALLQQALQALDRADGFTEGLPRMGWHTLIEHLRRRCQTLLREIDLLVQPRPEGATYG
jgi:hypothetical protein